MLDADQLDLARRKLHCLERPLTLRLDVGEQPTDDEDLFAQALLTVVEAIRAVAPQLLVVEHAAQHAALPCLSVANVRYRAVPVDREFEPFLELLCELARAQPPAVPDGGGPPDAAELRVLVAPTCPNCPGVVVEAARLAASSPELTLEIVDVQYFTALAGACRSVPTVIIDDRYTIVGPTTAQQLLEVLRGRGAPGHIGEAVASMLAAGRLDDTARLLGSDAAAARSLAGLMRSATMQQKVSLMLAVEQALAGDAHCLDVAVPGLVELLDSDDATLRGDTADLLGQIGSPAARPGLTRLMSDENSDVCEIAEEALDSLRTPS